MSNLGVLKEVVRSINIYDAATDEETGETVIDIPLEVLREIVKPNQDDPLLYWGYILEEIQIEALNKYCTEKIIPDFSSKHYVLEAYGIYER